MELQILVGVILAPATLFAFLLCVCFSLALWWPRANPTRQPPEPAGSWPIIGHLPLLGGSQLLHLALSDLADKYGPIFTLKLGFNKAVVVSNADFAKECLVDNGSIFVNRPQTVAVKHMAYNSAMFAFAPYCPYWREMRKISVLELLSNQRLDMLRHAITFEGRAAIKCLHDKIRASKSSSQGASEHDQMSILVDMKQWFQGVILNAMVRLVAGKSLREFFEGEEYNRYERVITEFFHLFGVFVVSDALPFLRWLDIGGHEKAMKNIAKELDHLMQGWLQQHKRDRMMSTSANTSTQDFMDVMLHILDTAHDKRFSDYDSDTIIKATCSNLILAGADTNATTLIWALSLLLNNRHVLKQVYDELDTHVGRERPVNDSDMKNLVYLQVVIKETTRLYPAGPLLVPREAIADCNVNGYHIRVGTQLFVNAYKIHRDPQVWLNPLEFCPERFLTTHRNVDVRGQNFELIPFGAGRRICPGISFALETMQYMLATLLHEFEITTPSNEAVDMTEGYGLSNLKATPLEVIFSPRLFSNLYKSS